MRQSEIRKRNPKMAEHIEHTLSSLVDDINEYKQDLDLEIGSEEYTFNQLEKLVKGIENNYDLID